MNWSEFNLDLLEEIARRIKLYDDFVAFSLVCSLFRSAAMKENFKFMSSHIPLLMLPSKGCSNSRGFFDLPEGTTRSILLPECDGKKCFSSKGWLITIDLDWNMSLLNPFSRVQVELPHMKTFENWEDLETRDMQVSFIGKCALSVNPSLGKDYMLMVIYGGIGKLAYFRQGDKVWRTIERWHSCYADIIYYKGQFYAIDHRGRIMVCDVEEDDSIVARQIANMPIELVAYKTKIYLVESAGTLLVVTRVAIEEKTIFQIFVVDLSNNTFTEIKNLGNRSLFLGDNSSLSIEISRRKPNCIYFTDDDQETYAFLPEGGGKDIRIYNLQDGSIEPLLRDKLLDHITPPLWVERSF
ncbi:hypothetical protein ACOSQ4_024787 [Xanthoceras sorbifolium]